jgi:hypothetical protein
MQTTPNGLSSWFSDLDDTTENEVVCTRELIENVSNRARESLHACRPTMFAGPTAPEPAAAPELAHGKGPAAKQSKHSRHKTY